MATKSPSPMHNQWPNVADPTELPNVSGASIQDAAVEVGDQCYSISDTSTYQCTTATVGSAVWASMGGSGGTDNDAIHDNVAGEIAAVTEKGTPVSGDLLLIEDSADSNNKKRVQVGNLPGGGADADAIHDNVAAEISAVTAKATPTTSDYLVIEDAADSDNKKSITIGDLPAAAPASHASTHNAGGGDALAIDAVAGTGSLRTLGTASTAACAGDDSRLSDNRTDADAVHDNVSGEINAVAEKASPVGADVLLIEDSAATYGKKKVQITNLPGGADADAIHDNVAGEIAAITAKATPVGADYLVIEDSADSNNKKSITLDDLPGGGGADADAIHDNVAGEIAAVTEKAVPVDADLVIIEDSEDSNNKKAVQLGNLPISAAESTSYRELTSNVLDTQGPSAVENDAGEGVFDAGLHQSIVFRATLTASWASTGTLEVKLYDDGPTTAPGTPRLVTTLSKTVDGGYEVFEQALTIVSSGASTDEVLGEARVYRVTIEVDGTTGDTGYIGSAGFVATGSAEALSADQVQAIAMSLNA